MCKVCVAIKRVEHVIVGNFTTVFFLYFISYYTPFTDRNLTNITNVSLICKTWQFNYNINIMIYYSGHLLIDDMYFFFLPVKISYNSWRRSLLTVVVNLRLTTTCFMSADC